MRLKFNVATFYIPVHEGVYLRSNNKGLILKGRSLYHLLEHLVPYLDGHTTLEELTDGLDAAGTQMITRLIEKLIVHHFLKDMSQDQLHALSPVVLKTYTSNITCIESLQTSAASHFEHFRNQQILRLGSDSVSLHLYKHVSKVE